jgi:hypothetical protein
MSKSESRKTNVTVSFRLTPEEHAAVKAAAEMQGIGPSSFARRCAFSAASLPPVPAYEAKQRDPRQVDTARALGMLGRLASSANQMAKVANSTGTPTQSVAVFALVDELKALRAEIVG